MAAAIALMVAGTAVAAPPSRVFVAKAGASDLYERTASQLVLGTTRDREVRRFATMMVADHSKSTQMIKSAARRSGLHPRPPVLEPQQRRMLADLRHARGRDRDRLYIDQQKQAHQDALGLMQDYASTGADRPLARAAQDIVPVIQHHIDMLGSVAR
jgi:putative membrane protein